MKRAALIEARTTAGSLLLLSVLSLIGFAALATPPTTPTVDTTAVPANPSGGLIHDLNANGQSLTNAATVSATNVTVTGTVNGVTITAGTNTYTLTVGTASMTVPAGFSGTLGALSSSNSVTLSEISNLGAGVATAAATGVNGTGGFLTDGGGLYQTPLTLTTSNTSGAATLTGSTLNIPQYGGGSSPCAISSTNATLVANTVMGLNTSSAAHTWSLPTTGVTNGSWVAVFDPARTWTANNATVGTSSNTFYSYSAPSGTNGPYVFNATPPFVGSGIIVFVYNAATSSWNAQ